MIETNKNELFPITVTLYDETTAELVSNKTVTYDIRTIDDDFLSPPLSGTLMESSVEMGIYKTEVSIPTPGTYICYATCSGFVAGYEDIVVNNDSIIEFTKANLPHNTSVMDVPRTTASGDMTSSQISRNVPFGKTDYIVTKIKRDEDSDWSDPVSSGISYAHYVSTEDRLPYMMGGPY